jgi:hypothetical protein
VVHKAQAPLPVRSRLPGRVAKDRGSKIRLMLFSKRLGQGLSKYNREVFRASLKMLCGRPALRMSVENALLLRLPGRNLSIRNSLFRILRLSPKDSLSPKDNKLCVFAISRCCCSYR